MDIEKCLSAAQKREMTTQIKRYIQEEIYSEAREEVIVLAKKWVKENEEFLSKLVAETMEKETPKVIKRAIMDSFY